MKDPKHRGDLSDIRICPHCDSPIPEEEVRCLSCGVPYWESKGAHRDIGPEQEDDEHGCFSIILLHFLLAVAVFVFFILIGFVINLFVHFEENQVKVVWIGIALVLAAALSTLFTKVRKTKKKVI
jgi:hypothetical protein